MPGNRDAERDRGRQPRVPGGPANCAARSRVSATTALGSVADGRGIGLDPAALGGQGGQQSPQEAARSLAYAVCRPGS
jgi:hypothetical protein